MTHLLSQLNSGARLIAVWAMLASMLMGGELLAGQQVAPPETPPEAPEVAPEVAPEAIDVVKTRIAALEKIEPRNEQQNTELAMLQEAVQLDQQATQEDEQTEAMDARAQGAPTRIAEIRAEIAKPIDQAVPTVPTTLTDDELGARIQTAGTEVDVTDTSTIKLQQELDQLNQRSGQIAGEISETTQTLTAVTEALAGTPDPEEPPALVEARRLRRLARQRMATARLNRLKVESRTFDLRLELLQVRREKSERDKVIAQRHLAALQEVKSSRELERAEQIQQAAEQAVREAADQHPVVQAIVAENGRLAGENQRIRDLSSGLEEQLAEVTEAHDRWKNEFDALRKKDRDELADLVGLQLGALRSQLPSPRVLNGSLRRINREVRAAQSKRLDLGTGGFVDIHEEAARLVDQATPPVRPERLAEVLQAVETALTDQRNIKEQLVSSYRTYVLRRLIPLAQKHEAMKKVVAELRKFIGERILWIQSTSPLGTADLSRTGKALDQLFVKDQWIGIGRRLLGDVKDQPVAAALLLVLLGTLAGSRRRMKARLGRIADQVSRRSTDRFGLTVEATLWTILMSAPWPLFLATIAWRLESQLEATQFEVAIAIGLRRVAYLLFGAFVIMAVCRPNGLGEAHFGWPKSNLRLVRRNLRWLVPVEFVLAMLVAICEMGGDSNWESLRRLSFMAAMITVAIFLYRVLHPRRGIPASTLARRPGGWLDRLRFLWFSASVGTPIALGAAAAMGYVFTAVTLERKLLDSIILLLILVVAQALVMRWLVVAQRRLAIEQARKKRAAAMAKAEAEAAASGQEGEATVAVEISDEEIIDVVAVSHQTRQLVRTLFTYTAVIGVLVVWSNVLPALGALRGVELPWSDVRTVGSEQVEVPITLANVALAGLFLLLTVGVSRNIPGLLEITILQRLPITAASRYAITTISSYTLVIVGLLLAFNAIGIGWSKVQWLAAAVTVGLGFGLQEIVANFVSGIIILFERPIRVGDTVSVGNLSGTVTRIRMRATTITDWDRKELIIPNKEFVTGQIVNWSLSDTILRVTIPVGIAYGSDTEAARRLLLEAARANERVLQDPPARALYMGFGDSSLEFQLRVFIAHINDFLATRDELHEAIDLAFRQAGIEIAFPQRDLHIRSINAPVSLEAESVVPTS